MTTKILTTCVICLTQFEVVPAELRRGHGKYCSKPCLRKGISSTLKARSAQKPPNVDCSHCGRSFYRTPSKIANSRSGYSFCNRKCKEAAQKLGGIPKIQPSHYGTGSGAKEYRQLAFDSLPNQCATCGYSKFLEVLEVHHKDRDRRNNNLDNLVILCPTCHVEEHRRLRNLPMTPK